MFSILMKEMNVPGVKIDHRSVSLRRGRAKAVVGGPAGPAMARPLFWPKMVSAGPQFSIIRPKIC